MIIVIAVHAQFPTYLFCSNKMLWPKVRVLYVWTERGKHVNAKLRFSLIMQHRLSDILWVNTKTQTNSGTKNEPSTVNGLYLISYRNLSTKEISDNYFRFSVYLLVVMNLMYLLFCWLISARVACALLCHNVN